MTIPNLINKIQDRHNIAHWWKTYATVYDAYKRVLNRDISPYRFTNCILDSSKRESKYGDIYFQFSDNFIDAFMEELNISGNVLTSLWHLIAQHHIFGIGSTRVNSCTNPKYHIR